MNYIVIDLEWNQSPEGKESQLKELPFEIIEIGAVKLDSALNIIDNFNELIKPQVYTELHYKTKEIITITLEDLMAGDTFEDVAGRFFRWCGINYIFCTWGAMDLTELQRNLTYYGLHYIEEKPFRYYDVQKLFALNFEKEKVSRTLEYAVDYLGIEKGENFHRALSDANYTVGIFRKLDQEFNEGYFSMDCFYNPKSKNDEITLIYETYSKYISMEFLSKEEALSNKEVTSTVCYKCGRRARKKIKWFSHNSKSYYCLAECLEHGYMRGKIRIKKTLDDHVFIIKTLKHVDSDGAQRILSRQEESRVKRKAKINRRKALNKNE